MSKGEVTRASRVREWIAANGPCTIGEVATALGLTAKQARSSMCEQREQGFLTATGEIGSRVYSIGKPAREWGNGRPELRYERRKRKNENRRKGDLSAEDRARIAKMAQAVKAARVMTTEHTARDKRDAARQVVAMRLSSIATSQASQAEDAETVEAYLARGGVIERLPPGTWSRPLMFEY